MRSTPPVPVPEAEADAKRGLGEFLDAEGHLRLPPGFSGSVNPSGYRIISAEGEALRFAPKAATSILGDGWTGFGSIGNGCNGDIHAFAISDGGYVYVGGSFTLCGDTSANNVARFDTITQTWSPLGSDVTNGLDNRVFDLLIVGSMVYVGGEFTQAGGALANSVARFDTTSQTWASLGNGVTNGVNGDVRALTVSGSALYVGGFFNQAGGTSASGVARFDTSTETWTPLGSGVSNGVSGIVLVLAVSGTTVYVGGSFSQVGVVAASNVARFDTTSQTWASLGNGVTNGVNGDVRALTVSGNALYVGGVFTQAGGASANNVARFDESAETWTPLGNGFFNGVNGAVNALAVSGSALYVGGFFNQAGGASANNVARFDTSSRTWAALGSGLTNGADRRIRALAVSGNTLYAGGGFLEAGGAPANRVARFDTTTQGWAPLGKGVANGVNGAVSAIAVSGGGVYVGGLFTQAGGAPANRVARFDTTTRGWFPLGSGVTNGVNNAVSAVAISGSTLYVGGDFREAGGAPANFVARFDTTTQTWAALGGGAANGVNGRVRALAVSGSTLYVGGEFTQAGGAPANNIARFDDTTQTWAPLGSGSANGVDSVVTALAVSGSLIYVGGAFSHAGGEPANGVARFGTSTQTWASLGSGAANGANNFVLALAVSDSVVFVGGAFTQAGGVPASRVASFDTTSQTWAALGSGMTNGVNEKVRALAVSDGRLYVGGEFTQAGGAPANFVARIGTTTQIWAPLGSGSTNGLNSDVLALAPSADGTLFVGGSFGSAGGLVSPNFASFRSEVLFGDGFE